MPVEAEHDVATLDSSLACRSFLVGARDERSLRLGQSLRLSEIRCDPLDLDTDPARSGGSGVGGFRGALSGLPGLRWLLLLGGSGALGGGFLLGNDLIALSVLRFLLFALLFGLEVALLLRG